MKEHSRTYNINKDLAAVGPYESDQLYRQIVEVALESFQPLVNDMRENLEQQNKLWYKIKNENEHFLKARDQKSQQLNSVNVASIVGGPILKIYDALDDIELFAKHLSEGRDFYEVVLPKLEKLYQQVGDVSGRLARERMEFEEYSRRLHLVNESPPDRRYGYSRYFNNDQGEMSAAYNDNRGPLSNGHHMSQSHTFSQNNTNDWLPQHRQIPSRPSSHTAARAPTEVRIDDEVVANLVAMDFDTDRVVAALKRHNNDFEQALNDLLSS
jgi:ALIX V-shaped domain binding to HIV/UBA/TS-N domain